MRRDSMEFAVEGYTTKAGRRAFTISVDAPSEKLARERTYTYFGANLGAGRHQVHIGKVSKL